ncbi:hypothetical protein C0991_008530 [Blastosporella zonata]|nr:hypothetical protein C0991_008530 [Blastosporella zonata]
MDVDEMEAVEIARAEISALFSQTTDVADILGLVQAQMHKTDPAPSEHHKKYMLKYASRLGAVSAVSLLLRAGVTLDSGSAHSSIHCPHPIEMMQAFVDHGNWTVHSTNGFEFNAMNVSVGFGYFDIVRWLLNHGANGQMMVVSAAQRKDPHSEMLRLLVDHGAEVRGTRALAFAARDGNLVNVECCLELGADVNELTDDEAWGVTREELKAGVGTALHAAAAAGQLDIVIRLLNAGADKSIKDSRGKMAISLARAKGYLRVAEVLEYW